jgi:hypothetical protein
MPPAAPVTMTPLPSSPAPTLQLIVSSCLSLSSVSRRGAQ